MKKELLKWALKHGIKVETFFFTTSKWIPIGTDIENGQVIGQDVSVPGFHENSMEGEYATEVEGLRF